MANVTKKVLLIDDDPFILDLMAKQLKGTVRVTVYTTTALLLPPEGVNPNLLSNSVNVGGSCPRTVGRWFRPSLLTEKRCASAAWRLLPRGAARPASVPGGAEAVRKAWVVRLGASPPWRPRVVGY